MARIKGKDLYLKDDDQIYFGTGIKAALWYANGELQLNHTLSGTWASAPYHYVVKEQVEYIVNTTISGVVVSGVSTHNLLNGLQGTGPDYYHLTKPQYTELTTSGVTSLHTHTNNEIMFFMDATPVLDSDGNIVLGGGY